MTLTSVWVRAAAGAIAVVAATANVAQADATLRVATQNMPLFQALPYSAVAQPQALFVQMVYDPLTQIGDSGVVTPGLAVRWTQESPTRWVFALRPGVTFSNGEPLTSKAVTDALAYLATEQGQLETVANQNIAKTIASSRARDDLTVEIETRTPDPILPLHLSFMRLPAPEAWRKNGRDSFLTKPVGTGPFVVTAWSPGHVSLRANRTSWRKPKVDGIEVDIVGDAAARMQAFTSGTVDIALSVSPDDRPTIESAAGVMRPRVAPNVYFLAFVTNKASPLQDQRVRQALNYAVNKPALIAAFLGGATEPTGQFSHGGAFGFDPSLAPYPYDPEKARALLKAAGYPKGFTFTALLDGGSGGVSDWFQQIAQDLARLGVTMNIVAAPTTRIADFVLKGGWTAEAFGITFAGFDSLRGYRFRSCELQPGYTCDRNLMPMIAAAEAAPTEAARRSATQAVLAAERENPPGIMLWRIVNFDALRKSVKGYSVVNDFIGWDAVTIEKP